MKRKDSTHLEAYILSDENPTVEGIRNLKLLELPDRDTLFEVESKVRLSLNDMLNNGLISTYPMFEESNEVAQVMVDCNYVKEFKY